MIYVGIDVHKMSLQVAAMEKDGTLLLNEKIGSDHATVRKFFSKFPKRAKYVMESSSVWYALYRFMTDDLGLDVVLSNPYQTKAIAASKKKTDKVDARILADLLRGGYIAECHVPDADTVESKQLVRYRRSFVDARTSFKNKIHGILLQGGVRIPGTPFSERYVLRLRGMKNYRINGYLDEIRSLDRSIADCDKRIHAKAMANKYACLLLSIPGVGNYTALTVAAEISDIGRFSESHKLCAYAGLVPSVRNSADTVHYGRITKRGSGMLRWVLNEAVKSHTRYAPESSITKFYNRIAKKRGKSKATVAAASKLLRVMHHMLKEERMFVTNYSQNFNTRRVHEDKASSA